MRADVFYNSKPVGSIAWESDVYGIQIDLDCALCGNELLRCYAVFGRNILRVGLPAPERGRLRLHRHLSREMLRAAGCAGMPERFYLAVEPETVPGPLPQSNAPPNPPFLTGDAVLDTLLKEEKVQIEKTNTGYRLSCAFDPQKPFVLAPVFVLCHVEGNTAVLEWKKDAAHETASFEKM